MGNKPSVPDTREGTKKAVAHWGETYRPHSKKEDFMHLEGEMDEILYDHGERVVFTLKRMETEFTLLEAATTRFARYRELIKSRPLSRLKLTVWRGVLHDGFAFVKAVRVVWTRPIGFKLHLYLADGTDYVCSAKENALLAVVVATALRDSINKDDTHHELVQILMDEQPRASTHGH